jgi:CrcB protein
VITLAVTACAGLGAVTRYAVDRAVANRRTHSPWPLGTFIVNCTGSFLLGLVVGLGAHHGLDANTVTVLGSGFAGGYTTLSTWALATVVLAEEHERRTAFLHAIVSVGAGLLAAAAGLGLARL